ncbi:hypothetical protein ACE10Z_38980 [Bradyrhizobium sp. Pha-3]|uniref:hypothetical protein n=1 Tax=Bradyrhizobium sp. Pha-3 TaxID=208375 RepID=UPI0035D3EE9E
MAFIIVASLPDPARKLRRRVGLTGLENNLSENQSGGNARREEIQDCVHAMRSGNASSPCLQKNFSIFAQRRNECRESAAA